MNAGVTNAVINGGRAAADNCGTEATLKSAGAGLVGGTAGSIVGSATGKICTAN